MYDLNNERCEQCGMRSLVTQTITGVEIDPPYWQCLANAEMDCLVDIEVTVDE